MQLEGTETLPASPEELWKILFDPDVIAATIPGCQSLTRVDDDHYTGRVELSMGPFSHAFDATFTILDREPACGYRMLMEAEGKSGTVTANTRIRLEEGAPGQTLLRYDSTAELGGTLGGLGFLGESVARMLVAQGLTAFRERIEARLAH